MINDPCEHCNVAYGHKEHCPTILRGVSREEAVQDWDRGKADLAAGKSPSGADAQNGAYLLGREIQGLEASGQIRRRKPAARRAPFKSEPRMRAVTAVPAPDTSS